MINADMRLYTYSTLGSCDEYGQPIQSKDPMGEIKMSIHLTSQSIQENALYSGATYVGLTMAQVDDSFVIHYKDKKLKVLYVNPYGRYNQVFMAEM
jgi:hypothetical protein